MLVYLHVCGARAVCVLSSDNRAGLYLSIAAQGRACICTHVWKSGAAGCSRWGKRARFHSAHGHTLSQNSKHI
jgi:hypothetical protein